MFTRLAITLLLAAGLVTPAAALEPQDLLAKVDRNLNPESFESLRKLVNIEPDGTRKEFVLFTAKKDSDKVVGLFLSPASDKGRSTLRVGDNMWLYMPDVGKPIRITSLQSVTGGVFNNSDILQIDYTAEYLAEGLEEQGNTYLLKLKARTDSVAYDRLAMTVDKETLLPMTIEAHAASGMLIKTLRFKDVKDFGNGILRPSVIETDSPLYKGYTSLMIFGKIAPREFSDEVFTLNFLPRIEELR
ncbi:MAG: outer membrane lipoprotein-sorting protein [Rhodospirillales bacterium]|nr:outer membrane lipoprotein-sorting protein [Rhodospirillales bacterium]